MSATEYQQPKTLKELGDIVIAEFGAEACAYVYETNPEDRAEIGRQALLFGDIRSDGTLN